MTTAMQIKLLPDKFATNAYEAFAYMSTFFVTNLPLAITLIFEVLELKKHQQ